MASMNKDFTSLALTMDQFAFAKLVNEAAEKLTKYSRSVPVLGCKTGPGYDYSDYVVTIRVSHDRQSCNVYRNRTSVLLYAKLNGNVSSINHEFIFVEDYIKSLLAGITKKEKDG